MRRRFLVVWAAVLLAASAARDDGCKPGWAASGSVCVKLTDRNLSWNDGRKACRAFGADLATPATQTDMQYLIATAEDQQWPLYVSIGLSRAGPDDWTWLDGRPMTWSFWHKTQPSNSGFPRKEEKCVEMLNQGQGGRWNDVTCDFPPRGPAACQMPKVTTKSGSVVQTCNFEDGNKMCGFTTSTGPFNWTLTSQTTGHKGTGPENDHTYTTSKGHYVFCDGSYGKTGAKGQLTSPMYKNPGSYDMCLKFFYHMNGIGVGTMNVYVKPSDQPGLGSAVLTKAGNHGQRWFHAKVTIPTSTFNSNYQVIFEGVRGLNYKSDIAIDDIEITAGACRRQGERRTGVSSAGLAFQASGAAVLAGVAAAAAAELISF